MNLVRRLKSDYFCHYSKRKDIVKAILNPAFRAVVLLRLAEGAGMLTFWLWRWLLIRGYSIDVGRGFSIGKGLRLPHPVGIVIGGGVVLGDNILLYQNVTLGVKNGGYPVVGNGCIIYANSVLVGGINIGDGAIVGALSYVDKSIQPGMVFKRK